MQEEINLHNPSEKCIKGFLNNQSVVTNEVFQEILRTCGDKREVLAAMSV